MKIGLILYSRSGNTLSVAEKLKEALTAKSHDVELNRIRAANEDPNTNTKIVLTHSPDAQPYDAVILGAPVQAFSLSPIMKAYLEQLSPLNGKKVALLVTQHFPKAWMGGSHSLKQMSRAVQQKGGNVSHTGLVNWTSKNREAQIADVVERLSNIQT